MADSSINPEHAARYLVQLKGDKALTHQMRLQRLRDYMRENQLQLTDEAAAYLRRQVMDLENLASRAA